METVFNWTDPPGALLSLAAQLDGDGLLRVGVRGGSCLLRSEGMSCSIGSPGDGRVRGRLDAAQNGRRWRSGIEVSPWIGGVFSTIGVPGARTHGYNYLETFTSDRAVQRGVGRLSPSRPDYSIPFEILGNRIHYHACRRVAVESKSDAGTLIPHSVVRFFLSKPNNRLPIRQI